MGHSSKKPRKKYDPRSTPTPGQKTPKREKELHGEDLFNEMVRSKTRRR